jgi:putative two-component system response regulator
MKTMAKSLPIVRHHHEKLDGSGYPDGLSGADLPLAVRIVTIADIFDALTTKRVYREALSPETAYEIFDGEIRRGWWDREVLRELQAALAETPGTGPAST